MSEFLAVTGYALLAAGALLAIRYSGQPLWRAQPRALTCPLSGEKVQTVMVQDIRTGQWKSVRWCSAHPRGEVLCERDCARLMNLGLPLPPARA
jgi:hypothetical protein